MKNRIVSISLAVALILSVGLVGCATEYVPETTEYSLTISSTDGGDSTCVPAVGCTCDEGTEPSNGLTVPEECLCAEGTEASIEATPGLNYRFIGWGGDVEGIADVKAAKTTIVMNGDYSIVANFVKQYNLTISSTEGGSVTRPGEGIFTYDEGEVVTLAAHVDKGYRFIGWTGDVATVADDKNPFTFVTMNADYIVTADFGDPTTQRATINVDGNPDDWSSLEPALVDKQGDSICGADADIKHIYTAIDDNYAYVMVETYGVPINRSAPIETNFDYKQGQHFSYFGYDLERYDDLHTNIRDDNTLHAWNDDDLDGIMETYPINGYVIVWGDVMELRIPLSQIENATYFNPTAVNIWDYNYEMDHHGCDPSTTYFGH